MAAPSHRKERMAGTIRKHIGAEIARQARDPRLATIYVETVELSPDLGLIRVGVRAQSPVDEAGRRAITAALGAMSKGLRASLSPVLRMRRMPELRFFYDQGQEHRSRIEAVLAEIREDDRHRPAQDDATQAEVAPGEVASGEVAPGDLPPKA
jgi:ribosome-binding factor A